MCLGLGRRDDRSIVLGAAILTSSRTGRSGSKAPEHITKARLVEEIVALFHEQEGVTVERNVRLPSLSDPTQIREIGVLVTGNVVGYSMRIPIECKNYNKRVSAGQIGEFKDKLDDVGLPVRDSLFVSVTGFGRDARRRARDHGIKLFELKGLNSDRLSSVVHEAFQSTVYLLLRVERVSFVSGRFHDELWSVMWLMDQRGNIRGGLWDIVWEKWQKGDIPSTWGPQELVIVPPKGWNWHIDEHERPREVTVTLKVIGLVLTAAGEAYRHVLKDILEQKYSREHIRAIFRDDPTAIKLTVVDSEEQLEAATRPGGVANIVFESERAPRIHLLDKLYWPPTEKAATVVQQRIDALTATGNPDWDSMRKLTFEELEGTDISAIWGRTWSGHSSSRGEDWPVKFQSSTLHTGQRMLVARRTNPKNKKRRRQEQRSSQPS